MRGRAFGLLWPAAIAARAAPIPRPRPVRALATLWVWLFAAGLTPSAPVPRPVDSAFHAPAWGKPIDPDKACQFSFSREAITFSLPAKVLDYTPGGTGGTGHRLNAPRLLRAVEGDVVVEVRVRGRFAAPAGLKSDAGSRSRGTTAGLLLVIAGSNDACVRLDFGAGRSKGALVPCVFAAHMDRSGGGLSTTFERGAAWSIGPSLRAHLRMEVRQKGKEGRPTVRALISPDGKKWTEVASFGVPVAEGHRPRMHIGIAAYSPAGTALQVRFDQFKLTPLPPLGR